MQKQKRLSSHETRNDCKCQRFMCFREILRDERDELIMDFNTEYKSKNEQDAYLVSMIKPKYMDRLRPRTENSTSLKSFSYDYVVKVVRHESAEGDGSKVDVIPVCQTLISIFGITNRRIQRIKHALITTGNLCVLIYI